MKRNTSIKGKVLDHLSNKYLSSRRFNGIEFSAFVRDLELSESQARRAVRSLLKDGSISLEFGDRHGNSYVKALPEEPREVQIAKFTAWEHKHSELGEKEVALRFHATEFTPEIVISKLEDTFCAYPSPEHLQRVVQQVDYAGEPFTLRLALGEPRFGYEVFDPSLLEHYRNDPRYDYWNYDIRGEINLSGQWPGHMPDSDRVSLQAFGFAYDGDHNRVLAGWLWDLSCLSPEHQQIWNAKRIVGEYKLHPDFYREQVLGEPHEGISVFSALIEQMQFVNDTCVELGRPQLFRHVLTYDQHPPEFGFLIRTTLKEFNTFVHLLDKLISDNINLDFFRGEIAPEHENTRADGTTVMGRKGSLQIMEEWLKSKYPPEAVPDIDKMMSVFKEVRKLRQRPAHAIEIDRFDSQFAVEQRILMESVVKAMNMLCTIFQCQLEVEGKFVKHPLQGRQVWSE